MLLTIDCICLKYNLKLHMIYSNMLVGSDVQKNMPDCETADISLNHRFNIKVI